MTHNPLLPWLSTVYLSGHFGTCARAALSYPRGQLLQTLTLLATTRECRRAERVKKFIKWIRKMKIKASVDVWHNVDIIRSYAGICKPSKRSTRSKERTESIPRHVFMYTNSAPNSSCDDDYPIKWACSYCKYKNVRADTLLKVEHRVGTSLIKKSL